MEEVLTFDIRYLSKRMKKVMSSSNTKIIQDDLINYVFQSYTISVGICLILKSLLHSRKIRLYTMNLLHTFNMVFMLSRKLNVDHFLCASKNFHSF